MGPVGARERKPPRAVRPCHTDRSELLEPSSPVDPRRLVKRDGSELAGWMQHGAPIQVSSQFMRGERDPCACTSVHMRAHRASGATTIREAAAFSFEIKNTGPNPLIAHEDPDQDYWAQ